MNRMHQVTILLAAIAMSISTVRAQVPERLAPADHRRPTTSRPPVTRTSSAGGLQRNPQQVSRLFVRLGLGPTARSATGRVYNLFQDGRVANLMGTYKIMSDGRFMIFIAGSDIRLDLHSAVYNPATNVVGAKYTGINLTAARNTGGGGINMSLNGTGRVFGEMQDWYEMIGNQTRTISSPRRRVLFVAN